MTRGVIHLAIKCYHADICLIVYLAGDLVNGLINWGYYVFNSVCCFVISIEVVTVSDSMRRGFLTRRLEFPKAKEL